MKHLLVILLLVIFSSCLKQDLALTPIKSAQRIGGNIVYDESFEGGEYFPGTNKQVETSYGFQPNFLSFYNGKGSGRFELRDSDPMNNNGTRAEISFPPSVNGNELWYSFKVYFPSNGWEKDIKSEIFTQWHQGGGVSPSITFETREDKYRLIIRPTVGVQNKIDLGLIEKDKWNNFVFHINHSSEASGLFVLWINGKEVYNYKGVNMYSLNDGFNMPKWKVGIYKWDWNGNSTTNVNKRVLFFDDVRIGKAAATYEEMDGSDSVSTIIPPILTEPKDTSIVPVVEKSTLAFDIIDAGTDKVIKRIYDGDSISLSSLSSPKLNMVLVGSEKYGSIRFFLKGALNYAYTDSQLPYALFGDNGKGNFYNNKAWIPPALGKYTITVLAYSLPKGRGDGRAAGLFHFTIVK